jgi:hypothetical protein
LLRVPLLLAYWEWYRRAEFTCDRAALICLQDLDPSLRALAKLAGTVKGYEDELNLASAIEQHGARQNVNKLVLLVSILENAQNTHPFIPVRLKFLREFSESEQYQQIMAGNYKRDLLGLHEGGERVKCACGTYVNAKLSFCPQCGRPLNSAAASLSCAQCNTPVTVDVKFCTRCGAKQPWADGDGNSAVDKFKNSASSFFKT